MGYQTRWTRNDDAMLQVEGGGGGADLLDRGVYVAPYRVRGRPVLIAIDHAGTLRAQRVVPEDWPVRRALGALRGWLDVKHPIPRPTLVPDRASPLPASSPEDPRSAMSKVAALLYTRRRRRCGLPPLPYFRDGR